MTRRQFLGGAGSGLALTALAGCAAESEDTATEEATVDESTPTTSTESGEPDIVCLRVNGLDTPLAVPVDDVNFGWRMVSPVVGAAQTAYQITVSDAAGTVVWDSGTIDSNQSQNVTYAGESLTPRSRYTWKVAVTDQDGQVLESADETFGCGLADGTYGAWEGAQWIGSAEMYFDAAVTSYFSLDATITIPEKSTRAGFVIGGDDYRLASDAMNIWGRAESSRFVWEIDVTDAKKPALNIYVVGMPVVDQEGERDEAKPAFTVDIPKEALAEGDVHKPIKLSLATVANVNQLTCSINGVVVDDARQLNPMGNTHDYNTFPNICKIGFAVPAGEKAEFSDIFLHYPGSYEEVYEVGDLFGPEVGATYAIFEELEGVTIDGGTITVEAADADVVAIADPSFGSAPMVRSEFELAGEVASATLFATAQGIFEAEINGQRVGEGWHTPGLDEYATRFPYRAWDVTELLSSGKNAIGVQLAEGWWSGYQSYTVTDWSYYGAKQAFLAQLYVTYTDGTTEVVVTDTANWKVFDGGPVRAASNFHGERYDATVAALMSGWSEADYNDAGWYVPEIITPRQNDFTFASRLDTEGHVVGELSCVKCLGEAKKGSGSYIYDMGENVMGAPRIELSADYVDEGSELIIRYAEILYPDLAEYQEAGIVGLMMVENLRAAMVTDFYVATSGDQVFEPHFTFRGFRYIEISGLKKELPAENVKLEKLSSVDVSSIYEGSNELVNRLFKNVQNSQASNFFSIPTDCPQRNERMGWTGDAQVFSAAASYNADVYNLYRNWLFTLVADQNRDGSLPVFAPTFEPIGDGLTNIWQGISWDAALMVIPYVLWQHTGNDAIVRDNIDAIERYLDYLAATPLFIPSDPNDFSKGEAVPELTGQTGFLADWLAVEETDANLINGAMYVHLLDISAQMAAAIGKDDLAETWSQRYQSAREKWNELYVDPDTGKTIAPAYIGFDYVTYGPAFFEGSDQDTEASYATPLALGAFSDENEDKAASLLCDAVKAADHTITSGFSGTPFLVPELTRHGYVDDAYELFEQEKYASWLYPVVNGATSVWERWNSFTVEDGFGGNNSMNSFDHFSLGAISEWMMSYHAGICHDGVDWQDFVLAPVPGGTFTKASATFDSPYGLIISEWEAKDGALTAYRFTVPANTSATLYLPVDEDAATSAELPEGIEYVGMTERNTHECATFKAVAGRNYELAF